MAVLTCHVCGEPAAPPVWAEGRSFCCPACRELWRAIGEQGLAALRAGPARARPEAEETETEPFRPRPAAALDWRALRRALGPAASPLAASGEVQAATLALDGLWCPSCAALVEHVLSRRPGVVRVRVDFAAATAEAAFDPALTDSDQMCRAIQRLGYGASRPGAGDAAVPLLLRRLAVAVPASLIVMMLSIAVWSGYLALLPPGLHAALEVTLWLLATPVVWWSGWPFLRGAWVSLIHARPSMDVLIAVGSLSAYAYSVAAALDGGPHIYFDTSCMLTTFLLVGRGLELATRDRAAGVMRLLADLTSRPAVVVRGGAEVEVPATDVCAGEVVVIRPGQRSPVDGEVAGGEGAVDESALSGESVPVDKAPGALVYAGSISINGRLLVRATRVGAATALGQTVAAVRAAQGRGRLQQLADRLLRVFVPLVLAEGAGTFAFWAGPGGIGAGAALWRAIAVLLIACPCALGVATPLAVLAGARRLGRLGVLLRAGDALERAAGVDTVLLDKTGTLTDGRMRLVDLQPVDEELLSWAASVEAGSGHPLAVAVVTAAEERGLPLLPVEGFREEAGTGVSGRVAGHEVRVGRAAADTDLPAELRACVAQWERDGRTAFCLVVDGRVRGALAVSDWPRPESAAAVAALKRQGWDVRLVTGDSEGTAASVSAAIGIDAWHARQLPAEKSRLVAELQAAGHKVAFVGDGVNDAAALVQADLGIALASGADVALEAGRLTLVRPDLGSVPAALRLGRATLRIIRQNLVWALLYNALAVPAAVLGYARPVVAAGAMVFSSAFVLGNSLRLVGWSPRRLVAGVSGVVAFAAALAALSWRGW